MNNGRPTVSPDLQQKWELFQRLIRASIGTELYNNWFSETYPVSLEDNKLTLAIPSIYVREQYEYRFWEPFSQALDKAFGQETDIYWSVGIVQDDEAGNLVVAGTGSAARARKDAPAPAGTDLRRRRG